MMRPLRCSIVVGVVAVMLAAGEESQPWGHAAGAEPPATLAGMTALPMPGPGDTPERSAIPPRNTGPAARAHSRSRRGRHGTTRIIRRTPEVMREDAARVKRGDLFSTWSNEYLE